MQFLKCSFSLPGSRSVVTVASARDGFTTKETFALSVEGFRKLVGADSRGGLTLGPLTPFYHARGPHDSTSGARRRYEFTDGPYGAIWDAFSASLFAVNGSAIIRMALANDGALLVSLVAGSVNEGGDGDERDDGRGASARFCYDFAELASDGCGNLYVGDVGRFRKVQLPASMRAEAGVPLREPAAGEEEATVTTLPFAPADNVTALAYVATQDGGSLIYATGTAFYRVPLGGGAEPAPEVLAGRQDELGVADGLGVDARFQNIHGMAVDADGTLYVSDGHGDDVRRVRSVAPGDGTVITFTAALEGNATGPAILPNGYLAMIGHGTVVVLDLGLHPAAFFGSAATAAARAGPPPRTLPTDLGALLDAQPDGTADLTIVVGERSFAVHRLILSARCDYFKPRLTAGTFADGGAAMLSLPDADPDAFALLLHFIYTGAANIPAALACAVAELADRLLLPELCTAAQAQVLAAVTAATVVGVLLWAESRGAGFSQLLSDLKAWYVANYEAVVREAGDSRKRLMVEAPDLMTELIDTVHSEASKRARTT